MQQVLPCQVPQLALNVPLWSTHRQPLMVPGGCDRDQGTGCSFRIQNLTPFEVPGWSRSGSPWWCRAAATGMSYRVLFQDSEP